MQPRRSTVADQTASESRPLPLPLVRVVIAKDGGSAPLSLEFSQPILSFGRAATADIRLDAESISRLHCTLELRADGLWIRDLGSLNGVYMDGERVQHAQLTDRSVVTVGPYRFRARQEGALPASRFPAPPPPPPSDEWTRPGFGPDTSFQEPLRPAARLDAVLPASAPALGPTVRAPAPSPAGVERTARPTIARTRSTPQPRPVRMGDTCAACHDGQALVWGDELRCRACWGDGAPAARVVRVGEPCPCCHQGSMLKWENGLRCRNCGNTGHSTRQAQPSPKFHAGAKCPSCADRPLLTWNGGLRCHGCGQGYR